MNILIFSKPSICGNSAYILGSTVEIETGLKKFLHVFSAERTADTVDIVRILCHLLTHADSECVLNAAGTLGTIVCRFHIFKSVTMTNDRRENFKVLLFIFLPLSQVFVWFLCFFFNSSNWLFSFDLKCSSKDGRNLIVHHPCIAQLIINTTSLLSSSNSWIASNAALVLAR